MTVKHLFDLIRIYDISIWYDWQAVWNTLATAMTTKEGYPPVSRENRRWEDGGFLTWRICMVAFLVLSYNQLALWFFLVGRTVQKTWWVQGGKGAKQGMIWVSSTIHLCIGFACPSCRADVKHDCSTYSIGKAGCGLFFFPTDLFLNKKTHGSFVQQKDSAVTGPWGGCLQSASRQQ